MAFITLNPAQLFRLPTHHRFRSPFPLNPNLSHSYLTDNNGSGSQWKLFTTSHLFLLPLNLPTNHTLQNLGTTMFRHQCSCSKLSLFHSHNMNQPSRQNRRKSTLLPHLHVSVSSPLSPKLFRIAVPQVLPSCTATTLLEYVTGGMWEKTPLSFFLFLPRLAPMSLLPL